MNQNLNLNMVEDFIDEVDPISKDKELLIENKCGQIIGIFIMIDKKDQKSNNDRIKEEYNNNNKLYMIQLRSFFVTKNNDKYVYFLIEENRKVKVGGLS